MKEQQHHIDAFEIYFKKKQEGATIPEAINSVHIQLKFSERSVYKWKDKFNWDDRETIRAAEINKEVQKKTDSTIIKNKANYLSFYHKLLNNLQKNFNIEIENIKDLDLVIKGALNLQDEAGETINHKHLINNKEKIDRLRRIESDESNQPITSRAKLKTGIIKDN